WREVLKWLGVSAVLAEGGLAHLRLFKGLVMGGKSVSEKLGVIWFAIVSTIWKARNAVIFNSDGFNWERVVEESKVTSRRIIKSRSKEFSYPLSLWLTNPIACLGVKKML
ncbi:hypothetical protein A2U01_0050485, partial [Trifolium medium]|nr:hypothetical protein [Trifolium medium]